MKTNRVDDPDLVLLPGDYYVMGENIGILMCCPGCGKKSGPKGKWKVDIQTESVTPSIHHDPALGGCGWHGYLTNGEFKL